jgi:hypothetical protein
LTAGSDDPAGCASGRNRIIDVGSFDATPGRRLPFNTESPRDQQSAGQHTAPAVRLVDLARRLINPLHHPAQGEHKRDERKRVLQILPGCNLPQSKAVTWERTQDKTVESVADED